MRVAAATPDPEVAPGARTSCASSTSTSTARTRSRLRCAPASSSGSSRSTRGAGSWTRTRLPRRGARLAGARRRRGADAGPRPDAGRDRDRFLQRPAVQRRRRARRARARAAGGLRRRQRAPVRRRRTTSRTGSSAACCRRTCRTSAASRSRPGSARPGTGTRSAATSTTSSRPGRTAGRSRSATCAERGPTPQRSRRWRATRCARRAIRGGDPPDELLRALNDAMLVDNPTDFQFCTVAFAEPRGRRRSPRGWRCRAAGIRSRSCCAPAARSSPSANRARCSAWFPTRPCRAPRSSSSAATRWSSTRTGSRRRAPRRGCSATRGC